MKKMKSFDGVDIAVHELGDEAARPVILLHGLFSSAQVNWTKFGHAQKLVDAGCRVIMPELRAHGHSDAPHDPAAYPDDVLARDIAHLVDVLGLSQYDLCGFSLGARTAVRCVIGGMRPRRLALVGMGLEGLSGWNNRAAFFIDAIDRFDEVKRGDRAFMAVSFMKTMKVDRVAARLLLQSVADTAQTDLAALTMPTLVLCGDKDADNGSSHNLAAALPNARHVTIPGTHMSSVTEAALGEALVDFIIS